MSRENTLKPYAPGGTSPFSRYRTPALMGIAVAGALYGAFYAFFFPYRILELLLPLLVMALLVIWALPNSDRAPTRLLGALFFSFFVLMTVWPDYLALSLPGLPWITARRIIAVPLTVTFLVCLSLSKEFRSALREVLSVSPSLAKLFAAFILLQLASIGLSRNPGLSIDKFIVAQLYWTIPFFIGCYLFRAPGNVARWSAIFCLTLVPLAVIGLWEWQYSRVPWAGRIPSFLVVEDPVVQRILTGAARAATGVYRVQSTFTTSLGYAEYMALAVPFLCHFAVRGDKLFVRAAALAAMPITFFMIVVTDSRLGIVGFLLSLLGYGFFWAALRWKRNTASLFGPAIVLAYPMIFGAFVAATFFVRRLERLVWGGGEHQFSTNARTDQYTAGLDIVANNPIGHGIGMGAETLGYTNLAGVLTIDTYYLLIALELGVVGFFIYYGMLLVAMYRAGRGVFSAPARDRELEYLVPAVLALGNFVVIKSIFSQDSNHPLAFMLVAAILGLLRRNGKSGVSPPVEAGSTRALVSGAM